MDAGYAWIVFAWIALHLAALAAAYGTRVAAGSRLENLAQFVCFGAMAIIGIAVWVSPANSGRRLGPVGRNAHGNGPDGGRRFPQTPRQPPPGNPLPLARSP